MARILIVDDDAAFRDSLTETLQDLGHAVLQAASTSAGLNRLRTEPVDLAIVDLRMPGDDGLVFLRKAAEVSAVPCIMLTAYASGGNTIDAMRLGAFDHLTKPVARAALVETLERALSSVMAGGRRRRRSRRRAGRRFRTGQRQRGHARCLQAHRHGGARRCHGVDPG